MAAAILHSAELYDPASGTWSATGSLNTARFLHTATLLPNGKVLVAGGYNGGALAQRGTVRPGQRDVECHGQPQHRTLSSHGDVAAQRQGAGGRGIDTSACALASAELYDPASGTWSATGSLTTARDHHTATLLPNGKVLVAGGVNSSGFLAARNCTTRPAGPGLPRAASTPHANCHTATLLPNGKVLVAGGLDNSGALFAARNCTTRPAGGGAATGSLTTARYFHTATLLPNGKVLVAGGSNGSGFLASAELYDPASGSWTCHGQPHHRTRLSHGDVAAQRQGAGGRGIWQQRLSEQRGTVRPGQRDVELPRAASPPHAIVTRRRCCPTARCWWQGGFDGGSAI